MNEDMLFLDMAKHVYVDPVELRRIFLILTRLHYSSPSNYGRLENKMREYVWTSDTKSRLNIALEDVETPGVEDLFPSIQINVGDTQFARRVMGDRAGSDGDRGLVATTPVIFHHFAKANPDEALNLCNLTSLFIVGLGDFIVQRAGFLRMVPSVVSTPKRVESQPSSSFQLYRSSFQVTIDYDYSWASSLESHLIRTATVKAIGNLVPGGSAR